MLRLICGPSGSGKTACITQMIRKDIEAGIKCLLLVPEQQAYISEQELYASLPQNAGLYFEIVNFSGLAEDIFREYGGITHATVTGGVRNLLMWDTLRTLAPMLKLYGKSSGTNATLTSLMIQTITELHNSGIDSAFLEETANKLPKDSNLQKKLMDLALVDAVYHQRLTDAFGNDPGDQLLRMASVLEKHNYFCDCHVYIDSFAGFTAQEYRVLRKIMGQAKELTVTVCADAFLSKLPHFETAKETFKRMLKLAAEEDVDTQKVLLTPQKDGAKPAELRILERDLWRFDLKKQDREQLPSDTERAVHLTSCINLYEESEAAALQILALVQSGMRYNQIAVVVRDTEIYRGVLDAALERHGIPCFLSERTDLSSKPLSRLILSALRAVQQHYHVRDIMTLVKTGLAGVSPKDAALFEEYCETWHISGSGFTNEVWSMNPDGLTTERTPRGDAILEAANRVRRTVITPLQNLGARIRASHSARGLCRAVYSYLEELEISRQLGERAKDELRLGQSREAGETVRLYGFITDTLSTLATVLPQEEITLDEFISALTLMLSSTDIGSIPPLRDCVVIGSASTLRVENVRASLLLGLCEGEFPRAITDDGILSENDKMLLESVGLSLDSREKTRNADELLFVYRAMTKPREKLFLYTSAAQTDGSARTPSIAFARVSYLLGCPVEQFDSTAVHTDMGQDLTEEQVYQLPAVTEKVTLRLSQSRIQDFVLCPYRYYTSHQLKLREKKDSTPSYADDGTFLHCIFEKFLRASLTPDGKLALPSPEEMEPLADQIIRDYLWQICPLPPEKTDRRLLHLFARLRKMALLMLYDIVAELRVSAFVPSAFEQVIGLPGENGLPPVVLTLSNGAKVTLSGKVDRIDLFEDGDKLFVRIVDYKSGKHKFSLDDVRSGLDIQLVLYLYAVLASKPGVYLPGGAEYLFANSEKGEFNVQRSGFLLNDPEMLGRLDGSEEKRFTKKAEKFSQEEIVEMTEQMKETVSGIAERILSGEAAKTPSRQACEFCPVRNHCDKAYHE